MYFRIVRIVRIVSEVYPYHRPCPSLDFLGFPAFSGSLRDLASSRLGRLRSATTPVTAFDVLIYTLWLQLH